MGENSKIEWTTHTFNPWIGCSKVHEGCTNCYAEAMMDKRYNRVVWGVHGTRSKTSDSNWQAPLRWNREAEAAGTRARVFCASLADVFEDRTELEEWRTELFELIVRTPSLDWLLLTKRPENIRRMWSGGHRDNVWLGTSISNQPTADKQVPELLIMKDLCKFLFLSVEPLLGPVNLESYLKCRHCKGRGWYLERFSDNHPTACERCKRVATSLFGGYLLPGQYASNLRSCDWVIVGGESGPDARPMRPEWAKDVRDQCQAAGVPFMFKQWGEYGPSKGKYIRGPVPDFRRPDENGLVRLGKKAAGRMLDGREWSQFPEAV